MLLGAVAPAQAHQRSGPGGPTSGLPIPNLTHGQMAVISDNGAAILDLARQQVRTDPVFRRLMNYAQLQRTYCLWGLVPGSVADEESPFNGCAHAYLAALRALLVHMQSMPDPDRSVALLVARIEGEMLRRDASLALCRYSGDAFNTAEVVMPRWDEVPLHPPSLLAFGGVALACAAGLSMLVVPRRRDTPPPAGRED